MSWRGIKALGPPRLRQAVPGPGEWVRSAHRSMGVRKLMDKARLNIVSVAMPRPDEGALFVHSLGRSL